MTERLKDLENILLDDTARIDEKDDALICLGDMGDIQAIPILLKIGSDATQDYLLQASAGESIARVMINLNFFEKNYIIPLTDSAKSEAINLLLSKKPEWKKMLEG